MKKIILILGIAVVAHVCANGQTGKNIIPKAGADTLITHQQNAPEDSSHSKHKKSKRMKHNTMNNNSGNKINSQSDK